MFADGLVLVQSVKVLEHGVLVAEPPNIWLMRDTNGDLRADTKELVTNQFGRRGTDPQENANGFVLGARQPDVHGGSGRPVPPVQERHVRGSQDAAARRIRRRREDDAGRIYRNTNESALHVDLVPTAYFARNPNLLRTRGSYERMADDNPDLNVVWPVRPNPGTNRAYQVGIDRAGRIAGEVHVCVRAPRLSR